MERLTYGVISTVIFVVGICMIVWPAQIAAMREAANDNQPPTPGTLLSMRIVGVAVAGLGAYALFAIVTRLRGVGFFPM